MDIVVSDYETTTKISDCRVWMWATTEIKGERKTYWGRDIASYMRFITAHKISLVYFHNLAFDGKFLVDFIMKQGYTWTAKKVSKGTFSTLVSSKNKFYQIKICTRKGLEITFRDSLKLLPFSVKALAEKYDAPMSKGEIDYKQPRPRGYNPTEVEISYTTRDTKIVAHALEINMDMGFDKMTVGANAMADYKDHIGKKHFKRLFPIISLECDAEIREAYRGGYCYVNPEKQGTARGAGVSADYNSMYPSVMMMYPYPVGEPSAFENKYIPNVNYPLYVQRLTCSFSLKPNGLPMVQLRGRGFYGAHEYVEETIEPVQITLTSVDLEIFMEMYEVDVLSYDGGWQFMAQNDLFTTFFEKWGEIKTTSTGGARQEAKNIMNNLYGKFATNPDVTGKYPVLCDDDETVYWLEGEAETRNPVYIPVGAFATAYARRELFQGIMANRERFIYCDTDSIHLDGTEEPTGIKMHDTAFGAWKAEEPYRRSKHLRAKAYVLEHYDDKLTVRCAGMPDNIKQLVTFENFEYGFNNLDENGNVMENFGKLSPKNCPGGVVLLDRVYTLHP